MKIIRAETDQHYDQARALFEEYTEWLDVDLCFQNVEAELRTLDRMYGPPQGSLLVALAGGEAIGCVAVRALPVVGKGACEMKRLYVRPAYRSRGVGRRLAEAVVNEGRRLGYRRMFLDGLERMEHARAVYQALGFREVLPYYHNPIDGVVFMELNLTSSAVCIT